ncbi:MAG TPA: hypothetical protein VKR58_03240 [Aquella sp.]|nr:hypothetical protein [Aquella sp.]
MELDNITDSKLKDMVLIVYVLQAVSLLVGITLLIGVVINYIKRSDAKGTWLESHFSWQIRTFWLYFCFIIVGGATIFIGVGYIILFMALVWLIYRICKGWIRLSENKPVY